MNEEDDDPRRNQGFSRRLAVEMGSRFRRYQENSAGPVPTEFMRLLEQLEQVETARPGRTA